MLAYATPAVAKAKVAALVAFRNRVITVGHNQAKTHPIAKRFGRNPAACFLHAEVDALYKASRLIDTTNCELYVARTWKNGSPAMAKPCSGCMKAIDFFGVSMVYYTNGRGIELISCK